MGLGSYNGFSGSQRESVQRWLNKQWDAGSLPRPSKCVACGQTEGTIDAHLEDYDTPASFVDMCVTCHMMIHMRFRNQLAWRQYRERIAAGWQAPPATRTEVFSALKRGILAGNWPRGVTRPAPGETFLDTLTLDRTPALFTL